MKKIGIVGGVTWLSTVEYYSGICRRSERRYANRSIPGPPSMPEFSIESLDMHKAISYLGVDGNEESWSQFDGYHHAALKRLEASGADFAVIASNTPHHRFEAIVSGVGIPVIDIFEVTAKRCARIGVSKVLILGTSVTMNSLRLRNEFAKVGIEADGPKDERMRFLTTRLIAALQAAEVEEATERLGDVARTSFQTQFSGPPVVCLACTELPLAFQDNSFEPTFEVDGVVYINTSIIHIEAAIQFAVQQAIVISNR